MQATIQISTVQCIEFFCQNAFLGDTLHICKHFIYEYTFQLVQLHDSTWEIIGEPRDTTAVPRWGADKNRVHNRIFNLEMFLGYFFEQLQWDLKCAFTNKREDQTQSQQWLPRSRSVHLTARFMVTVLRNWEDILLINILGSQTTMPTVYYSSVLRKVARLIRKLPGKLHQHASLPGQRACICCTSNEEILWEISRDHFIVLIWSFWVVCP